MARPARFKDTLPSYYSQSSRRKCGPAPCAEAPASPRLFADPAATPPSSFDSPATPPSAPSTQSTAIVITQPARKVQPRPQVVPRPTRPSLSDQLATIRLEAHSVVQSLTKQCVATAAFTVPTLSLVVGRLECKFPSPATFSTTECRYQFVHGARDIAMHMYYRDMTGVVFCKRALTLRFKIAHPLAQFGPDYDPHNRNHAIVIGLASVADWSRAKQVVLANAMPR
ncbi:hypothetical protein H310_14281 [Aphanomyces invadans]|uniref:Uncharacterized protein n=1 Tax=Aphanomyces invadans TaxID=157072 RepID=A0A024TBR3_9STRA|nr:hypothetical protein H310_14281 [Aphanomyces invadans]ETV91041.1 hypothetical protein H310_14281 [Aphanomyces invadans]|eukprot:XP_008880321.1 hypothetical protein H310_14281 [Aphanomyces invadans]